MSAVSRRNRQAVNRRLGPKTGRVSLARTSAKAQASVTLSKTARKSVGK